MCSLVGWGGGVNVGKGVGRSLLAGLIVERSIVLEGIKMHKAIAITTKIKPIGRRKRGGFRRENMRRRDMICKFYIRV